MLGCGAEAVLIGRHAERFHAGRRAMAWGTHAHHHRLRCPGLPCPAERQRELRCAAAHGPRPRVEAGGHRRAGQPLQTVEPVRRRRDSDDVGPHPVGRLRARRARPTAFLVREPCFPVVAGLTTLTACRNPDSLREQVPADGLRARCIDGRGRRQGRRDIQSATDGRRQRCGWCGSLEQRIAGRRAQARPGSRAGAKPQEDVPEPLAVRLRGLLPERRDGPTESARGNATAHGNLQRGDSEAGAGEH